MTARNANKIRKLYGKEAAPCLQRQCADQAARLALIAEIAEKRTLGSCGAEWSAELRAILGLAKGTRYWHRIIETLPSLSRA